MKRPDRLLSSTRATVLLAAALPALLAGCATSLPTAGIAPADAFMANLRTLCGQAHAGRVVIDTPASPGNNAFAGKALVMHVRDCNADTIRIPFHVGDDRSRTWVITRTAGGVRLKHDHRHADGSPDPVTQYGGDTRDAGSANRQAFPVDAESIAMFRREGLAASVDNTWTIEVEPGTRFAYELSRPGGRRFRVEFDLDRSVPLPPPAWGAQ